MGTGIKKIYESNYRNTWQASSGACCGFVKSTNMYYIMLKNIFKNNIIDTFISGIKEEIHNNLEYIEEKKLDFELFKRETIIKNAIKVDTTEHTFKNIQSNKYKLFINQIVRYLAEPSCKIIVEILYELKQQFPDISFWKLFHIANIIAYKERHPVNYTNENKPGFKDNFYDSYYQPYTSPFNLVVYDIDKIKKSLGYNDKNHRSKSGEINDATSSRRWIQPSIINNILNSYESKEWDKLKEVILSLTNAEKYKFKCTNDIFSKYLTKNKIYNGYISNSDFIILNNDFRYVKYKSSRFEIIEQ
jgi:hypothetical protein